MTSSRLLYHVADRVAHLTLNRPEKRNAFDDVMVQDLTQAFIAAGKDAAVKAIVLSANGPAFCAGADLEYLARVSTYDLETNRADSLKLVHLFKLMTEIRKPIVASVNGPALAGGCGLATACDIVIASQEHASFGYPEVRIGFIPAIVTVLLLRRVSEGVARELILEGRTIDAAEAFRIGLISNVVPAASLAEHVAGRVRTIVERNGPVAMGLCKELLSRVPGMNVTDALEFAANMNAAARMTAECRSGISAFLRKEPPAW